MITLMNVDRIAANLKPVSTAEFTIGRTNDFHPDGLLSEVIFGAKDSSERRSTFSYIDLNCQVIHPALVKCIWRLNQNVLLAIRRQKTFSMNKDGTLKEDPEGVINGITAVKKHFEEFFARKEETTIRRDMKNMILTYHKNKMVFIKKCLVIPAAYRDATVDEIRGGLRIPPMNEYYTKIIRQALQIESLSVESGAMYDILASKMQSLIDELYDYFIHRVSKKEGLVRQSILGKRADFTGRAVITGGSSEIKVDEIGVPFRILVKLFEPFILHDIYYTKNIDAELFARLLKDYNGATYGIPSIRSLLTSIQRGHDIPKQLEDIIRASIIRVTQDKVVLAKRDPALHAESVQGFKPVLVDGETIQLNPTKCSGFNADFDGDQMAIYVPVTKEAIQQAKEKMVSSESKDSISGVTDDFSKDIVIGLYALTQDSPYTSSKPIMVRSDEELKKMDPLIKVRYDGKNTTVGRVLFNQALPHKKFWINHPMNKKLIRQLVKDIYLAYYKDNRDVYTNFVNAIVELGMRYYTIMAPSFTLDDFEIPSSIIKLKERLDKATTIKEADEIIKEMEIQLSAYLNNKKNSNLGLINKAGGLKGIDQVRQILVSKGLIQGTKKDQIQKIRASYSDGLSSREYFESGIGSRQGIIDRVINTSDTGYLSRRLVFALQRVEANPTIKDCRTKRYFTIKVTPDIARRLGGRYVVDKNGKSIPFSPTHHLGKIVHLRSPMYCLTNKICHTCYGDLVDRNQTKYVGILAGEICGERLTQTIMRTFHVGGSVSLKTIDIMQLLSRIMSDSEKVMLEKNFKQEKSQLKSKVKGHILIDLRQYLDPKEDIKITDKEAILNYAYFQLRYLSYDVNVMIDNRIKIDMTDKKLTKQEHFIKIEFPENSMIFDCIPTEEKFSEQVKILEALLSGRTPWKNSDHFCMKIYDFYLQTGTDADLVHFEILASNLLRDASNPSYPARLNPKYNPVVKSLNSVPKLESWLQGFAFQDPKDAITTGLLYKRPSSETILERLITGNFD
jgi:DNA-directed RNA polymerase beta' subunit